MQTLRLDNEFFWSLTPFEFNCLVDQYRQTEQMWDYRFSVAAVLIANSNRDPKKQRKPFTPEDFFPSLAQKQNRFLKLSSEQLLKKVKLFNTLLSGKG